MEEKLTFEEGMQELDKLVQALEAGKMTLEDSFKAYERAIELRGKLQKMLDEGDKRIRVLTEAGERELAGESDA